MKTNLVDKKNQKLIIIIIIFNILKNLSGKEQFSLEAVYIWATRYLKIRINKNALLGKQAMEEIEKNGFDCESKRLSVKSNSQFIDKKDAQHILLEQILKIETALQAEQKSIYVQFKKVD